ncbi:hypothetical protein X798_05843 [Onchocerca flexuosa]|uniref:Uncharacterized protein n=1 Tax=Onchocerca flexuosa TaxID=387005 RepID=A0A238BPF1_9BILA|nr:hypothetical protein X798_05843 [Onchocerca flexuosa]
MIWTCHFTANELRMKPLSKYFSDAVSVFPNLEVHKFFQIHGRICHHSTDECVMSRDSNEFKLRDK